jgi:hypothetical protein
MRKPSITVPSAGSGGGSRSRDGVRDFSRLRRRQGVDADDLDGEVVAAALAQGLVGDGAGGAVEVVSAARYRLGDKGGLHKLVHAVGGQHKDVPHLQRHGEVVQLQLWLHAQGAAEVTLVLRHDHAVVGGELFQRAALQPADARVAHVEDVRRGGLEHQRAEGAHVTAVPVIAPLALPGLCVQPGVGGLQHALRGALDRPGASDVQ